MLRLMMVVPAAAQVPSLERRGPVQSVLVVVTNLSGTFSNSGWTSIDGYFVIDLQTTPDSYVDYIHPLTLPTGVTAVTPMANSFIITVEASVVTNNFLIRNTNCISIQPPSGSSCWLSASGTTGGKGRPAHRLDAATTFR